MKPNSILFGLVVAVCVLVPVAARGLGNDNPTGVAGVYNGNVTTGCSYDPYTGNATRTVDDIVVPGTVGAYPLAWRRHLNTRDYGYPIFGRGGHWSHSYEWGAYYRTDASIRTSNVRYPDGRFVRFGAYQANQTLAAVPGTSDRLRFNADTSADLLQGDGGRVHFRASDHKVDTITDPFGAVTVLAYDEHQCLVTVTEPGGRFLQIIYHRDQTESDHPWIAKWVEAHRDWWRRHRLDHANCDLRLHAVRNASQWPGLDYTHPSELQRRHFRIL